MELLQPVSETQLDHTVMPRTTFVNAPQLYLLAVERPILVLVAFANVELRTHVVMLVKLVLQDHACAELHLRVLE